MEGRTGIYQYVPRQDRTWSSGRKDRKFLLGHQEKRKTLDRRNRTGQELPNRSSRRKTANI